MHRLASPQGWRPAGFPFIGLADYRDFLRTITDAIGAVYGFGCASGERGHLLEPRKQVAPENECPAAALHRAQFASPDRFVQRSTSHATSRARFCDRVNNRCVHFALRERQPGWPGI